MLELAEEAAAGALEAGALEPDEALEEEPEPDDESDDPEVEPEDESPEAALELSDFDELVAGDALLFVSRESLR